LDIVTPGIEVDSTQLLAGLTDIVSRAAAAILTVQPGDLNRREKADRSPVTAADEASNALILGGLARLAPGIPVVSEEASKPTELGHRYFMVDPLDGTREFLAGRDEYTVNIALIEDGVPVAGVMAAPKRGLIWRGVVGNGAERLAVPPGAAADAARERVTVHTRPRPTSGLRVMVSRSHLNEATAAYVARQSVAERIPCGSALKFCLLAEGTADLYPRLAPTSEWDVAAGHALLLAAGGDVVRPDGSPLRYGKADHLIPAFIAFGDRSRPPPL
jgi:3'(2'), 5'-bisphosphate nucleotidase